MTILLNSKREKAHAIVWRVGAALGWRGLQTASKADIVILNVSFVVAVTCQCSLQDFCLLFPFIFKPSYRIFGET